MESTVEKRYPWENKTAEQLTVEINKALSHITELTPEEEIEHDAEYGYFEVE